MNIELAQALKEIADLKKENAELKNYAIQLKQAAVKRDEQLTKQLLEFDKKRTKAKELLHKICYEFGIYDKKLMEEAKQFLKENEVQI